MASSSVLSVFSKSSGSDTVDIYDFQLVEFDGGTVDFVPNGWVHFDINVGSLVTKFMPPPYNVDTFKKLNLLIRSKAPREFQPVYNWPDYPIKLIGQAKNFQEAEKKMKSFNSMTRKSSIYTEDSDYTPEEKAKRIEDQYRKNRQRSETDILQVRPVESDTSSNSVTTDTSWEGRELKLLSKKSKKSFSTKKSLNANVTKEKHKKNKNRKKSAESSEESSGQSNNFERKVNNTKKSLANCEIHLPPKNTTSNEELKDEIYEIHEEVSSVVSFINEPKQSVDGNSESQKYKLINTSKEHFANNATKKSDDARRDNLNYKSKNTVSGDPQKMRNPKSKDKDKEKSRNASNDIRLVLQEIQESNVEMKEIRSRLNRLEVMMERLLALQKSESKRGFIIEYNLSVPFSEIGQFLNFDTKLSTDQEFRLNFISSLDPLMDSNFILTKSVTNIFKKYFSKDVAWGSPIRNSLVIN